MMSDEANAKRGEAAWREQREATSRRNAQTRRRGHAEREIRENLSAARLSVDAQREAEQIRKLNAQLARKAAGSGVAPGPDPSHRTTHE
jgi:hypothetical protein